MPIVYLSGLSNQAIDAFVDSASGQSSEAESLKRTHPDYDANVAKWEKYLDFYEANDIYKYLHRHLRETPEMFEQRLARGYYYNYVASVVDLFVCYLFNSPIARNVGSLSGSVDLARFYADANKAGLTYEQLVRTVAVFAQICGHCGVLIDLPKAPEGGYISEADRLAADHRPYATIIQAPQIKDWEVDQFNKFEWVKIEVSRPSGRTWKDAIDTSVRTFLIWSRTDWEEYEVRVRDGVEESRLVDSGENPLGEVPIVIICNERNPRHPWFGLSAVRDIVDINKAILNWSSLIDEEVFERCLNILCMERDEGDAASTLSHHNVLEYAPGASAPFYLTPGSSPLDLIGAQIDRAKDEIYRLAKVGGSTGLLGVREATSGIAYAYEFNETNQALVQKAACLAAGENEIHRIFAKWLGKEWDGLIEYPSEFGVEDFLLELKILLTARTTLTSPSAVRRIEKRLIDKMFSHDTDEFRQQAKREIDAAPDDRVVIPPKLQFEDLPAKPRPQTPDTVVPRTSAITR
ncbi:MAG: hypothetical protein QXG97_00110 [Nitrososphaerota archaeon]